MKYLEFVFTPQPAQEAVYDVLSMLLAEIGFESFVQTAELDRPCVAQENNFPETPVFAPIEDEGQFKAYIQEQLFDEAALQALLSDFPIPDVHVAYQQRQVEDKNWNEEWEKNYFQPLVVAVDEEQSCVVHSTFHSQVPSARYKIVINPQMSFGTGHHQTTSQMLTRLLEDEVAGKTVLDMGCGTSILAILASKRGAKSCVAVDYDEWCVRNSAENIALNDLHNIEVLHGDAGVLAAFTDHFDLILANINRNIILEDLPTYVRTMKKGAQIYMSGFYTEDVALLCQAAEKEQLLLIDQKSLDNWACLKFEKQ